MSQFNVGDLVGHLRRGSIDAAPRFGQVLEIEGTRAKLLWEDNGKWGGVERYDLISEDEARREGLE
jgi:hypothetical protein